MNKLKLFRWGEGKHKTGYYAFTFFFSKYLDCYLIKYVKDGYIPKHKDPVKGKLFRLNIVIWQAAQGGVFKCNTLFSLFNRIHFFRPDLEYHEVSPVLKGCRYVFSIGVKTL